MHRLTYFVKLKICHGVDLGLVFLADRT